MAELSPMMKQYFKIKEANKDSILFYRLGDFYEMFYGPVSQLRGLYCAPCREGL